MKLPSILSIAYLPCSDLPRHILPMALSGMTPTVAEDGMLVDLYPGAKCSADSEIVNGLSLEKTTLEFDTLTEVPRNRPLAFLVRCVNGESYVIGHREPPFPAVEIKTEISDERNIYSVKVKFNSARSLVVID